MPAATTQSPPVRAGRASRFDQCRSAMCCCSYLEHSPVEFALKVDARDCEGWVYAVPVVNPPAKLGRSCQWQLCAQYKLFSSALDDTKMHYAVLLQSCHVLPYGKVAVPPTINKCGFTYERCISMEVECFLKC